ncbi:MAG: GDP-L-fucose synthase [Bacteroidales bacterium]|nr:GDP-L-fucose synthase [Bacteroidales bacterium]
MEINSRIYVAGHKGLVGSAIVKTLKEKGYTNIIGKSSKELDLRDPAAVKAFFEDEKPEYVFLAAAKVGGIVANNTYRAEFIYENLMIQNNVIHQAYKSGVKKLLFLGSTCIYPRECPQPMKEEYLLTSPLEYTNEPYAIAKIAGIKMCESYNLQYGTNFLSVMPTNLYGPNDNFDLEKSHVLPALIRKIHLGKCLEEGNWEAIREDLKKRSVKEMKERSNDSVNERLNEGTIERRNAGTQERLNEGEILEILVNYGITQIPSPSRSVSPSSNRSIVSVEIWGSGKPMREFLWSEEMAEACVFVMENVDFRDVVESHKSQVTGHKSPLDLGHSDLRPSTEVRNAHINIGTGKEISIKALAELVKKTVGFQGDLVFNTSKPDGTLQKLTDPSKLHGLGWHHKIDIEEGVEKMYEWYRKV